MVVFAGLAVLAGLAAVDLAGLAAVDLAGLAAVDLAGLDAFDDDAFLAAAA